MFVSIQSIAVMFDPFNALHLGGSLTVACTISICFTADFTIPVSAIDEHFSFSFTSGGTFFCTGEVAFKCFCKIAFALCSNLFKSISVESVQIIAFMFDSFLTSMHSCSLTVAFAFSTMASDGAKRVCAIYEHTRLSVARFCTVANLGKETCKHFRTATFNLCSNLIKTFSFHGCHANDGNKRDVKKDRHDCNHSKSCTFQV